MRKSSRGRPTGSEEEAKLATAYVNHLFYVRNDGIGVIHDWFKDALQKVGWVKVRAEEQADDARQKYEGVTQEQLAMLVQGRLAAGRDEVDDNGLLNFTVRKNHAPKSAFARWPRCACALTRNAR